MRWPLDQLIADLAESAPLVTATNDAGDPSLASRLATWTSEVEACIYISPGESSELIAFHDYWASLDTRDDIDCLARELPADVRIAVESWLRDGPDAEFVRLTEPDDDHLLVRAGLVDDPEGEIWDSRVPRDGLARTALEREALRNDSLSSDGAE